ncbi:hypothetical protein EBX31_15005 [bacterium]|nr:hypothetical protein [bacterium]
MVFDGTRNTIKKGKGNRAMAGATKRTGTSPTRIGCEIEPAAVLGVKKNWGEGSYAEDRI